MNDKDILRLYDREQRQDVTYLGFRRMETEYTVRQVSDIGGASSIVYTRLDDEAVDRVIAEEVDFFSTLGHEFEWKVYEHDTPADLRHRLVARGFEFELADALMVLDLEDVPADRWQMKGLDVRKLTNPAQLADVRAVEEPVWEEDFSALIHELTLAMMQDADLLSVYVAYDGGQPASCAWIRFHPHSQFASLWGGSTLPAFRRKGLYRELVAARANEALRRDVRFLTVDASPMSRPVLGRLGFRQIGCSYPCTWRPTAEPSRGDVAP